ncbi:alpha-(1,3)-fucosyltransferase 7-like [Liolophura sinensis]|uniref:alpha-(1,3)-fucosyltransferase 7-like n=1 Tax=Liolophura sinensis TaxID=3198878 RepID=UPI0031590FFC
MRCVPGIRCLHASKATIMVKWKILLTLCMFSVSVVFLLWKFGEKRTTNSTTVEKSVSESSNLHRYWEIKNTSLGEGKKKLILLWTKFFNNDGWMKDNVFEQCPVSSCGFTSDKGQLQKSHVVVFHSRNINDEYLPTQKWPHQRWLLFNVEPPYLSSMLPQKYNSLFNWTMSYRQDSDFVYSYNQVSPHDGGSSFTKVEVGTKTKLAIAIISNCFAINNRLEYVRELQTHMHLDFYGKCAGRPCFDAECNDAAMKKYKFFLAFENGNCLNYITEKFWNALLTFDAVPVVLGGSSPRDYELVAPPGSYINTADFSSPKELATYLLKLDKDDQLYMEYHNWRKNYKVVSLGLISQKRWKSSLPPHPAWCDLCAALHNSSLPSQVYTDLAAWYSQDVCPYDHPNVFCTSWNRCCFRKNFRDMFSCI